MCSGWHRVHDDRQGSGRWPEREPRRRHTPAAQDQHAGPQRWQYAPQLGPDAKSQVTVAYHFGRPVKATSIVVSTQHLDEALTSEDVRDIIEPMVRTALPEDWIDADTVWHVNPTGKFVIGGPDGDCGLTGRKIIVDTYGGAAPHGGGAFSGKDPTKVDRSAAYAARYLAKNVVAADLEFGCGITHWRGAVAAAAGLMEHQRSVLCAQSLDQL